MNNTVQTHTQTAKRCTQQAVCSCYRLTTNVRHHPTNSGHLKTSNYPIDHKVMIIMVHFGCHGCNTCSPATCRNIKLHIICSHVASHTFMSTIKFLPWHDNERSPLIFSFDPTLPTTQSLSVNDELVSLSIITK